MEGVPRDQAYDKAVTIFKAFDTNGDGSLDEEEFCVGCLDDHNFFNIIQGGVEMLKSDQRLQLE